MPITQLDPLRAYLLAKPATSEELPFGPDALVFKVLGKMFAIVSWQASPLSISLKCDPNLALLLRGTYAAVTPGYHLNKRLWNSALLDGEVPEDEVEEMIDTSYELVVKGLTRAQKAQLEKR